MLQLYNLILHLSALLLLPLLVMFVLWRLRTRKGSGERWFERWGFLRRADKLSDQPIWIHAVSVGETLSAIPLVQKLLKKNPGRSLVLTTTTVSGAQQAKQKLASTVKHFYVPYDTPFAVRRFLKTIRPSLLVIMENEIWPNLINISHAAGIKICIANACISEKSYRRYKWVSFLISRILCKIHCICAKSEQERQRFITLGGNPENIFVTGNLKFDVAGEPSLTQRVDILRGEIGQRPVWIAASIHTGEEKQVIAVHRNILQKLPDALLILAPRKPQAFDHMAKVCRKMSMVVARKSLNDKINDQTSILLLDTLGELRGLFALGQVAFMGGTLVRVGGHNILEAAHHALPIVIGPHADEIAEEAQLLQKNGALLQVHSQQEMTDAIANWLQDREAGTTAGRQALRAVQKSAGATDAILEHLLNLLP